MTPVPNHALRRLREGGIALGLGIHHLRGAAVPLLAQAAGLDWLFIDTEHGALTVGEASQICLAALATTVTPVVRVCSGALDEGTRALDNGAMGVVVPHVNTAAEARRVAEAFRYPPEGHRSWGGPSAPFLYRPPPPAEAQAALNAAVLVVAMIETPEAVANAGAIAAVPGIDALLIGTNDLVSEMGLPGQLGHPRVAEAYERVGEACRRHGRHLGLGGVYDEELAARYIRLGARLVLAASDHGLLLAGATARAGYLRGLA